MRRVSVLVQLRTLTVQRGGRHPNLGLMADAPSFVYERPARILLIRVRVRVQHGSSLWDDVFQYKVGLTPRYRVACWCGAGAGARGCGGGMCGWGVVHLRRTVPSLKASVTTRMLSAAAAGSVAYTRRQPHPHRQPIPAASQHRRVVPVVWQWWSARASTTALSGRQPPL